MKKNTMHIMTGIAFAAALCGGARAEAEAQNEAEAPAGWSWSMGEGIAYGETPIVSTELSLAFDSKYLSYGLVDNDDPILTPSATATFFDWAYLGVSAVFDLTTYGRKAEYGQDGGRSRGGRYTELDPSVGFAHSFSPDDCEWLPTTVEFDLGYMYEYHPRSYCVGQDDTQFVTLGVSLPDLWLEPTLLYERDIDRDNGTYVNLELGHTFELCEGLTFRPSVAQGFGNTQRVAGYLAKAEDEPLDHGGLMDTCVKGEFEWALADGVTVGAFVAYSDYLFDRKMRDAARSYEASGDWTDSWNFVAGLSVAVAF